MIIIISILLGILAYAFGKLIRKNYILLLVISAVLAIVGYILNIELVTIGFIGLAFMIVVMFAGAFPRDSKISKRLRSVRKEYSIFGVILLIPHAVIFLFEYFAGTLSYEWFGIIAMIIMIPLFVTSFTFVRKKMTNKSWKNLQRFAYVAYLLTFIHLLVVSSGANLIQYVLVFGIYFILKIWNYVFKREQALYKGVVTALTVLAMFRIAGAELIDLIDFEVPDTTVETTIESSNTEDTTTEDEGIVYADGVYSGDAYGFNALIVEVEVTISNNEITDISVISSGSTGENHGMDYETAVLQLAQDIVDNGSTDITEFDTVSGATRSTNGLLNAIQEALNKAIV